MFEEPQAGLQNLILQAPALWAAIAASLSILHALGCRRRQIHFDREHKNGNKLFLATELRTEMFRSFSRRLSTVVTPPPLQPRPGVAVVLSGLAIGVCGFVAGAQYGLAGTKRHLKLSDDVLLLVDHNLEMSARIKELEGQLGDARIKELEGPLGDIEAKRVKLEGQLGDIEAKRVK
jgi:hypothetical protein